MIRLFYFFILTIIIVLGNACSDVNLAPINGFLSSSSKTHYCTSPSDSIQSALKFIFIVDRSGSNQQRFDVNNNFEPLPGTDPDGSRRFDAILRFIEGNTQDDLVYWSMINLASDANLIQNFTNDKSTFFDLVSQQKANTAQIDGGSTNYLSALDRLQALIQKDMQKAAEADPVIASNYVVFYISDGAPFVNGQMQDFQQILDRVVSSRQVEDDRRLVDSFQFNTAYYFEEPVEEDTRQLLFDMSLEGNGDFLEFSSGQEIDLSQFAIPSKVAKFFFREIWVYNLNTVWYNGKLERDSDGDMLPDILERELGSDPFSYDSDGNGVGDGVEYILSGGTHPCKGGDCSVSTADPFITCRNLRISDNPVKFDDSDKDHLNNCEEKLLGTDMHNPDSNENYLSDRYAVMNGISAIKGKNDLHLDRDFDGISNYQELKQNAPVNTNNSSVINIKPMKIKANLTNRNKTSDCYEIEINDLAFTSADDDIRIEIFENTNTVFNKVIFRKAVKKMEVPGFVKFTNEDLK